MDTKTVKKRSIISILTLSVVAVVAIIIVTVVVVGNRSKNTLNEAKTNNGLTQQEVYSGTSKPDAQKLSKLNDAISKNKDAKAWIYIPGAGIDDPVLQASDNKYYQTKDMNKKGSAVGSYYFDSKNVIGKWDQLSQNTIIYGSNPDNNKTGKSFSKLLNFLDFDYVSKNQYIYVTTGESQLAFHVFAAFYTKAEPVFIDPQPSNNQVSDMLADAVLKSRLNYNEGVGSSDKLLTLYTTSKIQGMADDVRFVVMARLAYNKEKTDNTQSIIMRPEYKSPDGKSNISVNSQSK